MKSIITIYIVACGILYFFQEKLIFLPERVTKNYEYKYSGNFEELFFKTKDDKLLNGLLFKADRTKGLVFYLHGNSGSLRTWGYVAKTFTNLGYDTFILDYRGFGKSEGTIKSQKQLFDDNQFIYDKLKAEYEEKEIVIIGYSIGTGMAAKLASTNNPKQLILKAPYYNLKEIVKNQFSFIPSFILKYTFDTNQYLKDCKMPISIFHGNKDKVIPYQSSVKLKNDFSNIDLTILSDQKHNGISNNLEFRKKIITLLSN